MSLNLNWFKSYDTKHRYCRKIVLVSVANFWQSVSLSSKHITAENLVIAMAQLFFQSIAIVKLFTSQLRMFVKHDVFTNMLQSFGF